MDLHELLLRIASTYDRELDMQSEAQLLLRQSSEEVLALIHRRAWLNVLA